MGKKRKRTGGATNDSNAQGILDVQVLGTDANGVAPSVLVRTIRGNYIFNVGDGLQRFCVEHKVKLGKINGIFLTDLCSETIGGLPGALLTISDLGSSDFEQPGATTKMQATTHKQTNKQDHEIHIYGPTGTGAYLYAMRHFFRRPDFSMYATEFSTTPGPAPLEHGGLSIVQPVLLSPSA